MSQMHKLGIMIALTNFKSSMGRNLATLLAPEGITVNTVSSLEYGVDISILTRLFSRSPLQ